VYTENYMIFVLERMIALDMKSRQLSMPIFFSIYGSIIYNHFEEELDKIINWVMEEGE